MVCVCVCHTLYIYIAYENIERDQREGARGTKERAIVLPAGGCARWTSPDTHTHTHKRRVKPYIYIYIYMAHAHTI